VAGDWKRYPVGLANQFVPADPCGEAVNAALSRILHAADFVAGETISKIPQKARSEA
jgi:hypothetical protein